MNEREVGVNLNTIPSGSETDWDLGRVAPTIFIPRHKSARTLDLAVQNIAEQT